jgi:hypothetical protein
MIENKLKYCITSRMGAGIVASNRSFKDYVADRFYNEIFAAIQSYTTDNYDDLDLMTCQI